MLVQLVTECLECGGCRGKRFEVIDAEVGQCVCERDVAPEAYPFDQFPSVLGQADQNCTTIGRVGPAFDEAVLGHPVDHRRRGGHPDGLTLGELAHAHPPVIGEDVQCRGLGGGQLDQRRSASQSQVEPRDGRPEGRGELCGIWCGHI